MLGVMQNLARAMAIAGGIILSALVLLIVVSVTGRGGNSFAHWDSLAMAAPGVADALKNSGIGPVNGDFELVEAGIAFAIFAFLPLCQLYGGHATVDVFTTKLPARANQWLIAFWEVCLSAVILMITWRLFVGMTDKMGNGETTFILEFPVWWAFALSCVAAAVASIVAIYCAYARIGEAATGRKLTPTDEGPVH